MISEANSRSPLLCTNLFFRISVFRWTRRDLRPDKKCADILGKVRQRRARRDEQNASGSCESVTENTLLSSLRWKGVNTELVPRYSTARSREGRMPRPTESHCPGSLLKSPHLHRGLWWPEHAINKADTATTKHKNLFPRTSPEYSCMRPSLCVNWLLWVNFTTMLI